VVARARSREGANMLGVPKPGEKARGGDPEFLIVKILLIFTTQKFPPSPSEVLINWYTISDCSIIFIHHILLVTITRKLSIN
jgi:hypothetical protein